MRFLATSRHSQKVQDQTMTVWLGCAQTVDAQKSVKLAPVRFVCVNVEFESCWQVCAIRKAMSWALRELRQAVLIVEVLDGPLRAR